MRIEGEISMDGNTMEDVEGEVERFPADFLRNSNHG